MDGLALHYNHSRKVREKHGVYLQFLIILLRVSNAYKSKLESIIVLAEVAGSADE